LSKNAIARGVIMRNSDNNLRAHWLCLFILALCFVATAQKPIKDLEPTVILIAIDGFRADYFEKHQPETINSLAKNGVRAQWMKPSFPTKTFPNFYTVATGLYPGNHGIVENNIWDYDTVFSMSKREEVENPRWWGGEPIWVTAEKNNIRAASMFYPGTETEIGGKRPTFWYKYEHNKPREERVDQVLSWLDLPKDERPRMITLYFHDIDSAGHDFGPNALETRNAVQKIDGMVKRLVDGLKQRKIFGKVNLILFSDHGMAELDLRKVTFVDDYIDLADTERVLWAEQIVQIFPKPGREDILVRQLSKINYATCWKKAEIPAKYNYGQGKRVAPIVCSGDEGRFLTSRERYDGQLKKGGIDLPRGGHGYDNDLVSMRAMFVGHGSAFKRFYLAEPFPNVDVYELMCNILRIEPAKNDGNFERVRNMLR
jgi:Uncharacterized proteins of the AP superfamily